MAPLQAFLANSAWFAAGSAVAASSAFPRFVGLENWGVSASAVDRAHPSGVSACLASEPKKAAPPPPPANLGGRLHCEESKRVIRTEAEVFVRTYARTPVVIQSGRGCKLYDVEGREYLDMAGGIAVNSIGHGDPDWVKAVVEQAGTLTHVSNIYYTLPQVELGKRLVDCSFADEKFQRSSHSGDEEAPTEFIAFSNCFHGRTMGALALTSKEQYRTPFEPLMPGVTFIEYGDIEASKNAIKSGKVAAVFVEPIQGEGGIYSVTKEFLLALRSACDEAGALLVFDEVQCGLGRSGFLWAHEAFGVYPDIMTLAKPLAGGLPIGAVLATERVAASIGFGDHGSTFAGGPLVCHAALAVLDKIQSPGFLEGVLKKGVHLRELLSKKLGGAGTGDRAGRPGSSPRRGVPELRPSGLTAGKGNIVRLVPPLIISKEEIELAVEIISRCLPALDRGSSS
ncbi:unnamed protein product [Spirodela intermedia]|uniref:alanine--glyoxylate transaminase n=1 Tax=Spirodela intermedia TaxID=51605 RepID=A0A7I8IEW2_SPIIN|nr:unnamed protein product [Spirodela intermedia]CAA6656340.1 unnamed protein product [Spirodela intermedia]